MVAMHHAFLLKYILKGLIRQKDCVCVRSNDANGSCVMMR